MVVGNAKHGIEWNLVNGLNEKAADTVEMSVQERNDALVKVDVADIYSAKEMEAILLVGNRWNDYANKAESIPPVVHKSPTLPWGCERVLLTQDIIFDDTTMY